MSDFSPKEWEKRFAQRVASLGWEVTQAQQARLMHYIGMLYQWNQAFNLTAVRNPFDMIERHLIDSLSLRPYLKGDKILDAGTGAGLPGIPLAIVEEKKHFTLLDSHTKKQFFVSQVIKLLALENAEPVCQRLEQYHPPLKFSTILARALAPWREVLSVTRHLLAKEGHWLIMIGKLPSLLVDACYEAELFLLPHSGERQRQVGVIRWKGE